MTCYNNYLEYIKTIYLLEFRINLNSKLLNHNNYFSITKVAELLSNADWQWALNYRSFIIVLHT